MAERRPYLVPIALCLSCISLAAVAEPAIPTRTPLSTIPIAPTKDVSRIETTRVDFLPGQTMPAHRHGVPVVCFVAKGDFLVRIGDAPERRAAEGSTTYEPPGALVRYFRNASPRHGAELLCAALVGTDDHAVTVMEPPAPPRP